MQSHEINQLASIILEKDKRIAELEAEVIALKGNLGHPVPSNMKLPQVAPNALAEFIAKERNQLRDLCREMRSLMRKFCQVHSHCNCVECMNAKSLCAFCAVVKKADAILEPKSE